jgi:hypothetical protein
MFIRPSRFLIEFKNKYSSGKDNNCSDCTKSFSLEAVDGLSAGKIKALLRQYGLHQCNMSVEPKLENPGGTALLLTRGICE